MGSLSIWHWLIVLAVVLLLFGSRKLPDAARGLGRSMRIFKSEMQEMQNDGKPTPAEPQQLPSTVQPQPGQYVAPQQPQPGQYVAPQQPQPGQYVAPQQPPVQGS